MFYFGEYSIKRHFEMSATVQIEKMELQERIKLQETTQTITEESNQTTSYCYFIFGGCLRIICACAAAFIALLFRRRFRKEFEEERNKTEEEARSVKNQIV